MPKQVTLGKISGVHGIKGWLKVFSFSRPAESILQYKNWQLHSIGMQKQFSVAVLDHRFQGKKLLVKFEGVDSRTDAENLVGFEINIDERELLPLEDDEAYWRDLIGMKVKDTQGKMLGEVVELMETGANDVLLLKDQTGASSAVPWLDEVIVEVDTKQSLIVVDWQPLEL